MTTRLIVNVAKNGERFFSTGRNAIGSDADKAIEVATGLQVGFPADQGYTVSIFGLKSADAAEYLIVGGDTLVAKADMIGTPTGE